MYVEKQFNYNKKRIKSHHAINSLVQKNDYIILQKSKNSKWRYDDGQFYDL